MTVFTTVALVFTDVASAFAAVAAEITDETAITNTAAISVKFCLHSSNVCFSVG